MKIPDTLDLPQHSLQRSSAPAIVEMLAHRSPQQSLNLHIPMSMVSADTQVQLPGENDRGLASQTHILDSEDLPLQLTRRNYRGLDGETAAVIIRNLYSKAHSRVRTLTDVDPPTVSGALLQDDDNHKGEEPSLAAAAVVEEDGANRRLKLRKFSTGRWHSRRLQLWRTGR